LLFYLFCCFVLFSESLFSLLSNGERTFALAPSPESDEEQYRQELVCVI
jgi:hypothetical protein